MQRWFLLLRNTRISSLSVSNIPIKRFESTTVAKQSEDLNSLPNKEFLKKIRLTSTEIQELHQKQKEIILGTDEAINLTIRSSLQRDDFEKRKRRGRKILLFAITFVYLPFFAAVVYKSWGVKPEDHWMNHIDDDAKYYEKKYFEKMEQINESFKKK